MSNPVRNDIWPSIAIMVSSASWGLFWLPLRHIEESGIHALWTGPVIFAALAIVFLPFVFWRWRNFVAIWKDFIIAGVFTGTAFALYAVSLNMTEVVCALLLFYVSPVWSTILGLLFLGERMNINRLLGVVMGIGGLVIILGDGFSFPFPQKAGDWFALISGMCWSLGSFRLFQGGKSYIFEKTFSFVFWAVVVGAALAVLPLGIESDSPRLEQIQSVWIWIAGVTLFLIPASWMIIWPATVLSPARIGILFMAEAIAGITSAALLTDEPFGTREIAGTLLVIGAAIVEIARPPDPRQNKMAEKLPAEP